MTKTELAIARCLTATQATRIAKRAKAMVNASLFGLALKEADCILCMEANRVLDRSTDKHRAFCECCRLPKRKWMMDRCLSFAINGQTGISAGIDLTNCIWEGEGLTRARIGWLEGVIAICKERLSKRK